MPGPKMVVFIHGWSVKNTDTYGQLPDRLKIEASAVGLDVDVTHVYLSKYVSFRDEVRVEDIALGLEVAVRSEPDLTTAIDAGTKLVFITHSTGGPVAREWWHRFYVKKKRCPMSHLIMLAPANFGSALARLGKSTVSRLKSWTEGVQPGQGVLDWLELGSPGSWDLNESWIRQQPDWMASNAEPEHQIFQFVLTGQRIDRAFYDHVNSYTGETGSDGVVRVASANLNATYVKLTQKHFDANGEGPGWRSTVLKQTFSKTAPETAFLIVPKKSHAGEKMGIQRSVGLDGEHDTVSAIIKCLQVNNDVEYKNLTEDFKVATGITQSEEKSETVDRFLLPDQTITHPATTQVIVNLTDNNGHPLLDFDFLLTAWDPDAINPEHRTPSPDRLPSGFLLDVQRNLHHPNRLTFYLNHDKLIQTPCLGIEIRPRPEPAMNSAADEDYFVHFLSVSFGTETKNILGLLKPNATLLLDIEMLRVVRQGILRLTTETTPVDFTHDGPDDAVASPGT